MVLSGVPRNKSPVTPPGIDPGTVRLVAQRLIYIYLYIYIYMCVCVCVCVCFGLFLMMDEIEPSCSQPHRHLAAGSTPPTFQEHV